MRLLIGIIVALFAAVGIAILLRQDPGYVLISVGNWTIETSVVVLVISLIVAFVIFYYVLRYAIRLWRLPRQVKGASQRRRTRKSQRLLSRGMKHLAEGQWAAAESTLTKGVEQSETPALHYIGAARAAHQLHADWRRDSYLRKAEELPRADTVVVGLTKAELMLEDGQAARAKAVLLDLRTLYPRHPRVLELLAKSHRALGEWERLDELLPELRKRKVLDEPQHAELHREVQRALLAKAARSGKADELRALWKKVPKALRQDESLLIEYAGYLRDSDAPSEAEALLRDALTREWSEKLVVGYGEIGRGNAATQLATAEDWLKQHNNDPYLLLTAGRLAKRSRKWDKAKDYLERSIKAMPSPDAYEELGEVLEELNEKDNANQCFRAGLRLLSGRAEEKQGVTLAKGGIEPQVLPAAGDKSTAERQPPTGEGKTAPAS